MKWLACFWAAASLALAQNGALLSDQEALKLEQRSVQLMESTGLAVPGLAHAGAPALEDARQVLANLQTAPRNAGNVNAFLATARAYLAISDTLPKPYPFSEEGRRQFGELREHVDRLDSYFRALLNAKEAELRNPDRDDLKRYAEANEKLGPPSPQRPRVVFLGDSITDGWRLKEYYGGDRDFVNRGISGQITGEMLGRMKADVIDLKPRAVLVLAGTNDLARGVPVSAIENNLSMIADLAEAHHIEPMFASVLPVSDYHKDANAQYAQSARRPPARIAELNSWLKAFCEQRDFPYVDYYSALIDKEGFLQADASDDGLHPNAKGYRLMAPIALTAIDNVTRADLRPAGKKARIAAEKKAAQERKTVAEKAPPEREPAPVAEKKAPPEKKPAPEKTVVVKKAPPEKKPAPEKTVVVKKAPPDKKPAPEKTVVVKKAPPEKKPAAEKKPVAEKKTTAENTTAPENTTAENKTVAENKTTDAKKTEKKKKSGLRAWLEKEHK